QELTARDFDLTEGLENRGILYVFPVFQTALSEQKIRCSAADDLFRGSLAGRQGLHPMRYERWEQGTAAAGPLDQ
ncbi:MAG: hypothetical protein PUD66_06695, partial [Oscillospiraceae bacterium]|nr:hypothetical protein [Oscillospiraceae bacterium]